MIQTIKRRISNWISPKKQEVKINDEKTKTTVETIQKLQKPKPTTNAPIKKIKKQPTKRSKNNYTKPYMYFAGYDKKYFKTRRGKRSIPVTATEALDIISYRKRGFTMVEIHQIINWEHNISKATLENWIKKYNKGLMDLGLAWICNNNVEGIRANQKEVLHKFRGDI